MLLTTALLLAMTASAQPARLPRDEPNTGLNRWHSDTGFQIYNGKRCVTVYQNLQANEAVVAEDCTGSTFLGWNMNGGAMGNTNHIRVANTNLCLSAGTDCGSPSPPLPFLTTPADPPLRLWSARLTPSQAVGQRPPPHAAAVQPLERQRDLHQHAALAQVAGRGAGRVPAHEAADGSSVRLRRDRVVHGRPRWLEAVRVRPVGDAALALVSALWWWSLMKARTTRTSGTRTTGRRGLRRRLKGRS